MNEKYLANVHWSGWRPTSFCRNSKICHWIYVWFCNMSEYVSGSALSLAAIFRLGYLREIFLMSIHSLFIARSERKLTRASDLHDLYNYMFPEALPQTTFSARTMNVNGHKKNHHSAIKPENGFKRHYNCLECTSYAKSHMLITSGRFWNDLRHRSGEPAWPVG